MKLNTSLGLILVLTSIVFGLVNTVFVAQEIGWACLIPWEYYKESFHQGWYLHLSSLTNGLGLWFMSQDSRDARVIGPLTLLGLLIYFVFLAVTAILYWSPMMFIWAGSYYTLTFWSLYPTGKK